MKGRVEGREGEGIGKEEKNNWSQREGRERDGLYGKKGFSGLSVGKGGKRVDGGKSVRLKQVRW